MSRHSRRLPPVVGHALRTLAYLLCFGLAGLIWSLPVLRNRRRHRARTCTTCARNHRVATGLLAALTVLLLTGALARAETGTDSAIPCHSHVSPDGEVRPEPSLPVPRSSPWITARSALVAPASGLASLGGRALGMSSCSGPALLVMFWDPPSSSGGGTVIGDVFVAWIPTADPGDSTDYGIPRAHGSVRYGPNIATDRVDEVQLVSHERRHVDQWAAGTVLGGPLAFPVAYFAVDAILPASRNPFERAAGLDAGGYPSPPDTLPAPRWPETAALLLIVLLLARRRLRWASRVVLGGRHHATAHAPDRCALHTKGWVRPRDAEQPDRSPG